MKKITIMLITFLFLFSCKKEEEIILSPYKFPLKISTYNEEGKETRSSTYVYSEDFRLVEKISINNISLNGEYTETQYRSIYSYLNDKVSSIEYYRDNSDVPYEKVIFEYVDNKLFKETYYEDDGEISHVYQYEYNDNSELIKEYSISYDNGEPKDPFITNFEYTINSKKGLKENQDYFVITYDNYKSPFSEVPFLNVAKRNVIDFSYYNREGRLNKTVSYKNENEYDNDGFLIEKKNISESSIETTQYTYNK